MPTPRVRSRYSINTIENVNLAYRRFYPKGNQSVPVPKKLAKLKSARLVKTERHQVYAAEGSPRIYLHSRFSAEGYLRYYAKVGGPPGLLEALTPRRKQAYLNKLAGWAKEIVYGEAARSRIEQIEEDLPSLIEGVLVGYLGALAKQRISYQRMYMKLEPDSPSQLKLKKTLTRLDRWIKLVDDAVFMPGQ